MESNDKLLFQNEEEILSNIKYNSMNKLEFVAELAAMIPPIEIVDPDQHRLLMELFPEKGESYNRRRTMDEDHKRRIYENREASSYRQPGEDMEDVEMSAQQDLRPRFVHKNPKILATDVNWECKICSRDVKPAKMREHVGAHLVEQVDDQSIHIGTCGFCGLVGEDCQITLEQGSARGILVPYSSCAYFYKFNLKSASKEKSPCSNVPMQCPCCPDGEYVWKYVLRKHIQEKHPSYVITPELSYLMSIFGMEREKLARKNVGFLD